MRKNISADGQKYDVVVVKLIRNNNIVTDGDEILEDDTYFMLDYFDLLRYKNLINEDKIYRKFWNINDNYTEKDLEYKVAYKTLSLFTEKSDNSENVFKILNNSTTLSVTPFLGIIQIDYVYYYQETPDAEETLLFCEQKIEECLSDNGFSQNERFRYKIYRSSTSGDFCLVVKSAMIRDIFKIAVLINSIVIKNEDKNYRFNTYTNIGIECIARNGKVFLEFQEETIRENEECRFALRFTTSNEFAEKIYTKLENKGAIESLRGLFGRYDYLLRLSMKEFADIYTILCESKIIGYRDWKCDFEYNEDTTLTELLSWGIRSRRMKIINERALVSLEDETFDLKKIFNHGIQVYEKADQKEINIEAQAGSARQIFGKYLERFHELKKIFYEESRAFTDINRAFGEMISTYVPQGIDNDSYVNWQILTIDLRVIFKCAFAWESSYKELKDDVSRKHKRAHFLQDMRLVIDAVNQYYKFLQNVNMHTWQSPLYEIQTQLDAEKMMIAYREFLYDYFKNYERCFEQEDIDKRPMFYPIVYPDLSIEQACAMVVFQEERNVGYRILICRVPSFEYYGRMFNMIPWILHEASHSIRMIPRDERNRYLFKSVMKSVFLQAMYKLLNQSSNDVGYFKLGKLEEDIVARIVDALGDVFNKFAREMDASQNIFLLEFNRFETEIISFLFQIFDRDIHYMEGRRHVENIKAIQKKIFSFLGELNLLDAEIFIGNEKKKAIEAVSECSESMEILHKLLELIYNKYYENMIGSRPQEQEWKLLLRDVNGLEDSLKEKVEDLELKSDPKRDYLFRMRELNRLYWAWRREGYDSKAGKIGSAIWRGCISDIRKEIANGFNDCEGFVELHRILNVIFGYEEEVDTNQAIRINRDFNILFQEEVIGLVEREITIYRETCADLYMAAALGLTAFGYCRQIFQTISDTGHEDETEETNSTNISRFRVTVAILLGEECNVDLDMHYVKISMSRLWENGKAYCKKALECAKNGILNNLVNDNGIIKKDIEFIYQCLDRNVDEVFEECENNEFYEEKFEGSVFGIYLAPEIIDSLVDDEGEKERRRLKESFRRAEKELSTQLHIIYRIKYFIDTLNLISSEGNIVISKGEYEYFNAVYKRQKDACQKIREGRTCKVVSAFYNDPDSAVNKSHESMLEDTLDFIQTYYYKNRFKVMSSINAKGGRINWEKK